MINEQMINELTINERTINELPPPLIENKHKSPSHIHRSRHPTLPPLYFPCCRCCLLDIVLSSCPFLLSCIIIRLIVVLNIDPPLDRKQTHKSPSHIHRSRHPASSPLYFPRRLFSLLVIVLSRSLFSLSCIVIRLIVVLNTAPQVWN